MKSLLRSLVGAVLLMATSARADHFSGVNLGYQCLGGGFYQIYLELYLDCAGVPVVNQQLRFSNACGTPPFTLNLTLDPSQLVLVEEVSPVCQSQLTNTTCNGGPLPGFRRHRWERNIFLFSCSGWTIEWFNCCRNVMNNIVNEPGTYVSSKLNNAAGDCNSSPRFPETGIPYLCAGQFNSYNPGVTDMDGDFLVFSLQPARFGTPAPFPVTYATGHSSTTPIPGMTFDPISGQFSGTPTVQGNYTVVFRVEAYDTFGTLVNMVERDVMFVVIVCDDSPPVSAGVTNVTPGVTNGPNSIGVCNGVPFCFSVVFSDPTPTTILTIQSNITAELPGATVTVTGTNPATVNVCWVANEAQMPRNLFIQAFDGACPIENVASRSIVVASCLILPVELMGFDGRALDEGVMLDWATATERDSKRFVVERSMDGEKFLPIGEVAAQGHSGIPVFYSFLDGQPLLATAYYRLLQEDNDGSMTYSRVVSVSPKRSKGIVAFADADGGWTVFGLPPEGEWRLMDLLGRVLVQRELTGEDVLRVGPMPSVGASTLLVVRHNGQQHVVRLPLHASFGTMVGPHHTQ